MASDTPPIESTDISRFQRMSDSVQTRCLKPIKENRAKIIGVIIIMILAFLGGLQGSGAMQISFGSTILSPAFGTLIGALTIGGSMVFLIYKWCQHRKANAGNSSTSGLSSSTGGGANEPVFVKDDSTAGDDFSTDEPPK